MSERSDEVVVEGGTVEHWPPLGQPDRTEASPLERAFRRILEALKEMLGS